MPRTPAAATSPFGLVAAAMRAAAGDALSAPAHELPKAADQLLRRGVVSEKEASGAEETCAAAAAAAAAAHSPAWSVGPAVGWSNGTSWALATPDPQVRHAACHSAQGAAGS
jgi:hypothetical protein